MVRNNLPKSVSGSKRRGFLKTLGAVGLAGAVAGCSGGGGDGDGGGGGGDGDGGGGTTVQQTTVDESEMSPNEWRNYKLELAQEELQGSEQIVWATGIDDQETLDKFFSAWTDIWPELEGTILIDNSSPTGIRERYAREAAAGRTTFDVIDLPMTRFVIDGVPVATLDHIPSFQQAPDFAKYKNLLGASGFEARTTAYNGDLVSDPPETFDDLFRPEFGDGSITIDYTPSSLAVGAAMEKYGQDRIRELVEQQEPRLIESTRTLGQDVALGNTKLGFLSVAHYKLFFNDQQGEPYFNVPGTELWTWRFRNLAKTYQGPHPHATDLFIDTLMNPENPEIQALHPGVLAMDLETIDPPSWTEHFNGEVWTFAKISVPPEEIVPTYQQLINAPTVQG